MSTFGPQLPPHLRKNQDDDASNSEDDAYGPALPPHMIKSNKDDGYPSSNHPVSISNHLELGVASNKSSESSDDSDGEIIGPLPSEQSDGSRFSEWDLEQRSLTMKRKLLGQEDGGSKEPQRESWMLELPELKRKNFGLGPRVFNRTDKPEIKGRDEWTSTPGTDKSEKQEKQSKKEEIFQKHLEEKRNKELEKIVKKHDKEKRSKSLLNMHEDERKKRKKTEESKRKERRPFDRDEDLKLNQLDDAKRKALIKRSQELNSKFKVGNQKFL